MQQVATTCHLFSCLSTGYILSFEILTAVAKKVAGLDAVFFSR
jgi:hypothetical protein